MRSTSARYVRIGIKEGLSSVLNRFHQIWYHRKAAGHTFEKVHLSIGNLLLPLTTFSCLGQV